VTSKINNKLESRLAVELDFQEELWIPAEQRKLESESLQNQAYKIKWAALNKIFISISKEIHMKIISRLLQTKNLTIHLRNQRVETFFYIVIVNWLRHDEKTYLLQNLQRSAYLYYSIY